MLRINRHAVGRCMVVGCHGKALYRNPQRKDSGRGYCAAHKACSVTRASVDSAEFRNAQSAAIDQGFHLRRRGD